MKFIVVVILSLISVTVAYDDVSASVDFEAMLKDKTKLHDFYGCFLDQNPCPEETQHVKNHLKELLSDGCKECSTRQKHYAHVMTSALKEKFPEEYELYKKRYDPEGKLFSKFETSIMSY